MGSPRRPVLPVLMLFACALFAAPATATPAASSGGQRPELHLCHLGPARPLRCGQIAVPMRRGDPSLGTTKVAFAVRTRSD